jgi:hypothetical protein
MLLQFALTINELIGIALLVGLALMLTILTKVPFMKGFICYCLIISPFLYQGGLIELWIIVLLIISIIFIDVITLVKKRVGGLS